MRAHAHLLNRVVRVAGRECLPPASETEIRSRTRAILNLWKRIATTDGINGIAREDRRKKKTKRKGREIKKKNKNPKNMENTNRMRRFAKVGERRLEYRE